MLDCCVMSQVRHTEIRALRYRAASQDTYSVHGTPGKVPLGMFGTPQPLAFTRPTVVQLDIAQLPQQKCYFPEIIEVNAFFSIKLSCGYLRFAFFFECHIPVSLVFDQMISLWKMTPMLILDSLISSPCPRQSSLEIIPFTAAHTYIYLVKSSQWSIINAVF